MKLTKDKLKSILVGSGFVTEKDFDEAAKSSEDLYVFSCSIFSLLPMTELFY